ncbi:MAG: DUF4349 domain-containing protein [Chloroflexi bacterium]|nr:DUF4349 domain-containing protein [Chloroflexota bacterium]
MNKLLKILIPILVILGLVLAAGCAKAPTPAQVPPPTSSSIVPAPAPPGVFKGYTDVGESRYAPTEPGATETDRKIVKTGYMTLQVNDITEAMTGIARVAKELDGYVVSSNKQGDKDITTEAQYLELLKKAEKVEDMLAVQRELSNVRGQIEQVKGRIQYLERTSDMALIEVNLQKTKPIDGTGWSALETLKSAVRGLFNFGKVLATVVIWLAIFSPIWIVILLVVLYFKRWRKKKARTSR